MRESRLRERLFLRYMLPVLSDSFHACKDVLHIRDLTTTTASSVDSDASKCECDTQDDGGDDTILLDRRSCLDMLFGLHRNLVLTADDAAIELAWFKLCHDISAIWLALLRLASVLRPQGHSP